MSVKEQISIGDKGYQVIYDFFQALPKDKACSIIADATRMLESKYILGLNDKCSGDELKIILEQAEEICDVIESIPYYYNKKVKYFSLIDEKDYFYENTTKGENKEFDFEKIKFDEFCLRARKFDDPKNYEKVYNELGALSYGSALGMLEDVVLIYDSKFIVGFDSNLYNDTLKLYTDYGNKFIDNVKQIRKAFKSIKTYDFMVND
ncbi:hypothetical protein ACFL1H_00335 [Nanoarchaeota archaeon]